MHILLGILTSSELVESLLSIKRVLETALVLGSKAMSASEVQHGSFATLLLGYYAVPLRRTHSCPTIHHQPSHGFSTTGTCVHSVNLVKVAGGITQHPESGLWSLLIFIPIFPIYFYLFIYFHLPFQRQHPAVKKIRHCSHMFATCI